MQKNLSLSTLIALMASIALLTVGLSLAAEPESAKPTPQAESSGPDVIALEPGPVDEEATPLFCADQGCSCSGAGCRCTTSSGSYCSNSADGQTCTSGPCGSTGGDNDTPAQDIFQQRNDRLN